jgi:hypothetical protein
VSSATRKLINAAGVVTACWIAYVIYGSFSDTGIWRAVDRFFATDYHDANPAGVFSACALAGIVPLGAVTWLIWRLALRGRSDEDFPDARARKRRRET